MKSSRTAFKRVKNGTYAYITDKTYLRLKSLQDCNLTVIDEEFFKSGFGLALQDGWPYKKYFDLAYA